MTARLLVHTGQIIAVVVSLLCAVSADARSARAFGEAADPGQVGVVLAFQQVMETPLAVHPVPAFRPTFRADLVAGLPGHLDLVATGHVGGRLFSLTPIWEVAGGFRLAPFGEERDVRPSLRLSGGMRTVPGDPTLDVLFSDDLPADIREGAHLEVGLSRIGFLLEFHRDKSRPLLLLRFSYEAHWITLTNPAGTTEKSRVPALASNLWEARIGMLTSAEKMASPFFEVGLFGYLPVQPEEMSGHAGLIVEIGVALGSSGRGERFTIPQ